MFKGCLSVHLFFHLSVLLSVRLKSCSCNNSRMHEGYFFKLGGSIYYDSTMNSLEFGFHRSKVEITIGPNMDKIQFWSHNSIHMYHNDIATFVNKKDLMGQC